MRYLVVLAFVVGCATVGQRPPEQPRTDASWQADLTPIRVYFTKELPKEHRLQWHKAVAEIHSIVGRKLFLRGKSLPDGVNTFDQGQVIVQCQYTSGGATASHYIKKTTIARADVFVDCLTYYDWLVYKVLLHEAMHVLGFEHDTNPGSIMYRNVTRFTQKVMDYDKKELRRLYGK